MLELNTHINALFGLLIHLHANIGLNVIATYIIHVIIKV